MRRLLAASALLLAMSTCGCEHAFMQIPMLGGEDRALSHDPRYSPYSIAFERQNDIAKGKTGAKAKKAEEAPLPAELNK